MSPILKVWLGAMLGTALAGLVTAACATAIPQALGLGSMGHETQAAYWLVLTGGAMAAFVLGGVVAGRIAGSRKVAWWPSIAVVLGYSGLSVDNLMFPHWLLMTLAAFGSVPIVRLLLSGTPPEPEPLPDDQLIPHRKATLASHVLGFVAVAATMAVMLAITPYSHVRAPFLPDLHEPALSPLIAHLAMVLAWFIAGVLPGMLGAWIGGRGHQVGAGGFGAFFAVMFLGWLQHDLDSDRAYASLMMMAAVFGPFFGRSLVSGRWGPTPEETERENATIRAKDAAIAERIRIANQDPGIGAPPAEVGAESQADAPLTGRSSWWAKIDRTARIPGGDAPGAYNTVMIDDPLPPLPPGSPPEPPAPRRRPPKGVMAVLANLVGGGLGLALVIGVLMLLPMSGLTVYGDNRTIPHDWPGALVTLLEWLVALMAGAAVYGRFAGPKFGALFGILAYAAIMSLGLLEDSIPVSTVFSSLQLLAVVLGGVMGAGAGWGEMPEARGGDGSGGYVDGGGSGGHHAPDSGGWWGGGDGGGGGDSGGGGDGGGGGGD